MGKYLDIAKKFEAKRAESNLAAHRPATYSVQQQSPQPKSSPDYRTLYLAVAEDVSSDCWALDPSWLLSHPEFYGQIVALDGKLSAMERLGGGEQEYRATLAQMVKCVTNARAAQEREQSLRSALQ